MPEPFLLLLLPLFQVPHLLSWLKYLTKQVEPKFTQLRAITSYMASYFHLLNYFNQLIN